MSDKQENFSLIAKDMFICQAMSITLPLFYQKTGISPLIKFSAANDGLIIELGFAPKEPTQEQFDMFINDILESEQMLINNNFLKNINEQIPNYQSIEELKEDLIKKIKLIAFKRKEDYLKNI